MTTQIGGPNSRGVTRRRLDREGSTAVLASKHSAKYTSRLPRVIRGVFLRARWAD